jgi:drug/metabolite transporter (DMT)-like permease
MLHGKLDRFDGMGLSSHFGPAFLSLAAMALWGTSDFLGGYASRRMNAYLFTLLTHSCAFLAVTGVAVCGHAEFPGRTSVLWALAAGTLGGFALALFYRALSSGQMGLTAPVAAVLGAAIPALVGVVTDGWPGTIVVCGFVLAAIGIWLIARPESGGLRSKGIGIAVLAGIGFAMFYLCIHRTGNASALWSAALSRSASLTVVFVMVAAGRQFQSVTISSAMFGVTTGLLDITGTALFIRANQMGRLDSAVVLSSLYPTVTVLLARAFLHEHFTRWKVMGMLAALAAVPLIAAR